VGPDQRYTAIQAAAHLLASRPESEVDMILATANSPIMAPAGWAGNSEPQRLSSMKRILADVTDDVLVNLIELLLPERERMPMTAESALGSPAAAAVKRTFDGPIFVVHGHSLAALHEAVRVLERGTGREVIVLHEQANSGRTILEKFEDHATDASFAVVLLTADDEGGSREATDVHFRGRQNVIFELGFFFGKLGRRRVAVLLEANIEKPSDIDGLVYISLDQAGAWKQALARELEAVDIVVDRSRIP
jgi:predicted nucleotide-binding protein